MNYYNEFDPKAAAWLRELIKGGHIANGVVDERSITDVQPDELREYTQCHFFAGIGGWSYALRLAGWPDDRAVWTGSCPCQPFSCAGKQLGTADKRHLWPDFRRLIAQCRPANVFGEQVASAAGREWLAGVRDDLEAMAYAVGASDLCAAGAGAPHIRQRLFWVANSYSAGWVRQGSAQSAGWICDSVSLGAGETCGLANAEHTKRREVGGPEQDVIDRNDAGRPEAHGELGARREIRRLADSDGGQSRDGGVQSSREHRQQPQDDGACGLGYANQSGPQGRVERGHSSGEWAPWSASVGLACTDGKTRRIPTEPALFPMVDGFPIGRVGVLRGGGNAIVPQIAAHFIQAAEESAKLTLQ